MRRTRVEGCRGSLHVSKPIKAYMYISCYMYRMCFDVHVGEYTWEYIEEGQARYKQASKQEEGRTCGAEHLGR